LFIELVTEAEKERKVIVEDLMPTLKIQGIPGCHFGQEQDYIKAEDVQQVDPESV
jgi:hypothetical protein